MGHRGRGDLESCLSTADNVRSCGSLAETGGATGHGGRGNLDKGLGTADSDAESVATVARHTSVHFMFCRRRLRVLFLCKGKKR